MLLLTILVVLHLKSKLRMWGAGEGSRGQGVNVELRIDRELDWHSKIKIKGATELI